MDTQTGPGPHVVDVTDDTFEQVVVEGSREHPVVVDMWADWCGPCKTLGPILEGLAARHDGAFTLAKLDVDANPGVSGALFQALRSQSIPTVVAFRDGQVVDGFIGAYPQPEVEAFLARILPADAGDDHGDVVGGGTGESVGKAEETGDGDDPSGATDAAEAVPDPARLEAEAEVREWSALDPSTPLEVARREASAGHWREALEGMLAVFPGDPDGAREAMVTVFAALGEDDPLVPEFRRRLASALF